MSLKLIKLCNRNNLVCEENYERIKDLCTPCKPGFIKDNVGNGLCRKLNCEKNMLAYGRDCG